MSGVGAGCPFSQSTEKDSMDAKRSGYPEFSPPEGMKLEGEAGESMVNWKRKADGSICIVAMDGVSLGDGSEEVETEEVEETAEDPELDYESKLDEMSIAEE